MAWADLGSSPTTIRLQRYDAFGDPVGRETTVGNLSGSSAGSPDVTGLPNGGYAVSWLSSPTVIQLQKYTAWARPTARHRRRQRWLGQLHKPLDIVGLPDGSVAVGYGKRVGIEQDAILRIVTAAAPWAPRSRGCRRGDRRQQRVHRQQRDEHRRHVVRRDPQRHTRTDVHDSRRRGDERDAGQYDRYGYPAFQPVVAVGARYATVWRDGTTLRGQFLTSSFVKAGSEFTVALESAGSDSVGIAATSSGGLFVAYVGAPACSMGRRSAAWAFRSGTGSASPTSYRASQAWTSRARATDAPSWCGGVFRGWTSRMPTAASTRGSSIRRERSASGRGPSARTSCWAT